VDGDIIPLLGIGVAIYETSTSIRRGWACSSVWYSEEDVHDIPAMAVGYWPCNRIIFSDLFY